MFGVCAKDMVGLTFIIYETYAIPFYIAPPSAALALAAPELPLRPGREAAGARGGSPMRFDGWSDSTPRAA